MELWRKNLTFSVSLVIQETKTADAKHLLTDIFYLKKQHFMLQKFSEIVPSYREKNRYTRIDRIRIVRNT